MTIADRFSGWICVYNFPNGSATSNDLISQCTTPFLNSGPPDEFSSDGGPQFTSNAFTEFLQTWGVAHCLSSVSYPQSNVRAEAAVKNAKPQENTASKGNSAVLQHPLPGISVSPAQILFHRTLHDFTLAHPKHYEIHKDRILSANQQEMLVGQQKAKIFQTYDQTRQPFKPLSIGATVLIQNTSNNLQDFTKLDKNGTVIEVLPHRQCHVQMSGSHL